MKHKRRLQRILFQLAALLTALAAADAWRTATPGGRGVGAAVVTLAISVAWLVHQKPRVTPRSPIVWLVSSLAVLGLTVLARRIGPLFSETLAVAVAVTWASVTVARYVKGTRSWRRITS